MKNNRSAGPDLILNEFIINSKHVLVPVLYEMFNKIYSLGYFPDRWSEGFIIPLHKKGKLENVENYRGITLLSCVGKLFTRILNNRLQLWAENYNVYVEAQAGFRPSMSTVDNIFVLNGLISSFLNQKKQLYCTFIDFTKAFDYVVRENLWSKLIKLGLRGKILNIIQSMYTGIKSRIKYMNALSDPFQCILGVRQGESLSPFLFTMFLNDLEDTFMRSGLDGIHVDMFKVFLMLYADDIVLFADNETQVQKGLDALLEYCQTWKLKVNTDKTKIMVFRKGGRLSKNLNFHYDGNSIEIVNKFSYLGIAFTSGGSFKQTQNTLAGQAQKAVFKLNRYLHKFTYITPAHRLELFDKLVSPILNYGSEVWGFAAAPSIERVHLQFCKKLLGVKKTTQNDFIYGELGRTSFQVKRYYNIIKYWTKILISDDNKYINKIYNMLKREAEENQCVNWCVLLRDLLGSLGLNYVWISQTVGDIKFFLALVKQRLNDQFVQNWEGRLNDSSRAIFYRKISNFEFQPYLNKINMKKFCQSLTKLRVSSHRLAVETGRWNKPVQIPFNDRKCRICSVLDDEFHFVLECKQFEELRKKYIPRYYRIRPNMVRFVELINNTTENTIRNLSMFVYYAFQNKVE